MDVITEAKLIGVVVFSVAALGFAWRAFAHLRRSDARLVFVRFERATEPALYWAFVVAETMLSAAFFVLAIRMALRHPGASTSAFSF